ncbi:OmpH family outer membrane protein [Candidatus Marithrix sp. Canyon 246]|uniref:OmpH family outer membrane protein n=1 Tax=Candidatus Marithrix sp. Canyon 246 TaxID=1827136 RepID=UPI00084A1536|nr:OmpH family outer membrane protein [Candidatus Marithrix sp. Canyon 246]
MKKNYIFICLLSSILFSHQANAVLKVGFVNAIKVMEKAPQVEKANRRLEREFAPRQKQLVKSGKSIKSMESRVKRGGSTMSQIQVSRLKRRIRNKKREFRRQQEEFREDYNIRRNAELEKIQKIITKVIQQLAKRERYDFILSDGVVWASKRVDITNKVLRKLRRHR